MQNRRRLEERLLQIENDRQVPRLDAEDAGASQLSQRPINSLAGGFVSNTFGERC